MDRTSTWEQDLLVNLESASPVGSHTAGFIRKNNVAIITVDNGATNIWWKLKLGSGGLQLENTLYISRYLREKPADSPWMMASFVHEVRHLEQGFWAAFSVYGEMDAWQHGFNFYTTLPGHHPLRQPLLDLLALPLSHDRTILRQAQRLINQHENEGTRFRSQVVSFLKKEKPFNRIYWILALPLNPLFS